MGFEILPITLFGLAVLQCALGTFKETPAIGSVLYGGAQRCNAVSVASDFAIVPAGCIRQSDPIESYSLILPTDPGRASSHPAIDSERRKCKVKRFLPHPSHHFLSNNIGLIAVSCANDVRGEPNFTVRDVTVRERRLTLVGRRTSSRRQVVTPVHVQDCSVCLDEYGAFDCMRQLCLQLVGNYRSKLNDLDGLAGAAVLAPDGSVVGLLSYGFANSSLVAERVKFYELFVREMVSSCGSPNPRSSQED